MDQQITQEELAQIQAIQQDRNKLIYQLGLIQIEKAKLKQSKAQIHQYLEDLDQDSQTLSQFLEDKYGKCSIDMSTGQITQIQ